MTWLEYANSEVKQFHTVFQREADLVLAELGLGAEYRWEHHPTDAAEGTPDFVLRHIDSRRWIVAVEIKRTPQSVWSPQAQFQAKGYAESNQAKYRAGWPAYFVISNLEIFVLGAINGAKPPKECIVQNGVMFTGVLGEPGEQEHRRRIREAIAEIVQIVLNTRTVIFDLVWPAIVEMWLNRSADIPALPEIRLPEPETESWCFVRDFFADEFESASGRILLLRCLAIEYLRGTLIHHGHPQSSSLPPLKEGPSSIADSLNAIRTVDFHTVFESYAADIYSKLDNAGISSILNGYVRSITTAPGRVADLARRIDAPSLLDAIFTSIAPPDRRQAAGKVQTDPELAAVLSTLAIGDKRQRIVDIGCGDGSLLSAAYDRLTALGGAPAGVQPQLVGIEADPVSLRIASMRLGLKEPALISATNQAFWVFGDVFCHGDLISDSDVILMNPPFKRYEDQDDRPVPMALRDHYAAQIKARGGAGFSREGQSNLYSYYAEYAAACVVPGAIIGFILDNKWYHNKYAESLRYLFQTKFEIIALIEYPHSAFFRDWMISTSIIIARRVEMVGVDHEVQFVRCSVDPRSSDLNELAEAIHGTGAWPLDWKSRAVLQSDLDSTAGWKPNFGSVLQNDLDGWAMPTLPELFNTSRRGSLNKEGGGLDVLEFPFGRNEYGPRRLPALTSSAFATLSDRVLTASENDYLRELADAIPMEFRGFALKNSDVLSGYVLVAGDLTSDMTIEPPYLRSHPEAYRGARRARWTAALDAGLDELLSDQVVGDYIAGIDSLVNLSVAVPAKESRWLALREPFAGELIIPRKIRGGYRVHINPFALDPSGRQVRLSSNFISYGNLVAVDVNAGLDASTALRLVTSFLLSAFGQLQLESKGYNREGLLSVEKMHLDAVRVFDPRWVAACDRQALLDAFDALPYPIPVRPTASQDTRLALDRLWSEQLAQRFDVDAEELLTEVWKALDELILARGS
jgi:hypothetical protein